MTQTHGLTRSPTYRAWCHMKDRCTNTKTRDYMNYGGRGITLDPRWLLFQHFLDDMGIRPEGHSIDRINNDGGYSKENCRWATSETQNNNTRANVFIDFDGKRLTLTQWSREVGIPLATLYYRYENQWPVQEILTSIRKRRPRIKVYARQDSGLLQRDAPPGSDEGASSA